MNNKVQLIGHVGQAPEIFNFNNGGKKASFSIATNEAYVNKEGQKVQNTQWHNIVAYGKVVDVIENYVNKGKEIAVTGKLNSRSYEAQDGTKRYITEVILNELLLLGKKEAAAA